MRLFTDISDCRVPNVCEDVSRKSLHDAQNGTAYDVHFFLVQLLKAQSLVQFGGTFNWAETNRNFNRKHA